MVARPQAPPRGTSALGCLVSIVLVAVLIFVGMRLGKVWWRFYEIEDRMRGAAHFGATQNDEKLQKRLAADVDEINLPAEAKRFRIIRQDNPPQITISTEYHEVLEFPFYRKVVEFKPHVSVRP